MHLQGDAEARQKTRGGAGAVSERSELPSPSPERHNCPGEWLEGKGETAADSGKIDGGGMFERFPEYPPQGPRIPGHSGALIAETQRPAEQNRPRCRSLANHPYPAPAPDFSETVFLWLPDCGQTLGTRGLSLATTAAEG